MSNPDSSLQATVRQMGKIASKYLNNDDVETLVRRWQAFEQVSVKMIQQCLLDMMTLYPELKFYKNEIRRSFWSIAQNKIDLFSNSEASTANNSNKPVIKAESVNKPLIADVPINNVIDKKTQLESKDTQLSTQPEPRLTLTSETIDVFYMVMDTIKQQLDEDSKQILFTHLSGVIKKERALKKYRIDVLPFLNSQYPPLPDDVDVLNSLVQVVYAVLCDVIGPSEADTVLYQCVSDAKQRYPAAIVEPLF